MLYEFIDYIQIKNKINRYLFEQYKKKSNAN